MTTAASTDVPAASFENRSMIASEAEGGNPSLLRNRKYEFLAQGGTDPQPVDGSLEAGIAARRHTDDIPHPDLRSASICRDRRAGGAGGLSSTSGSMDAASSLRRAAAPS